MDERNQADIPVQRKACREFCEKMGWIIVREEQEAGVSGFKVSADDRDKIQVIKQHAERGDFDILLVFMFDRLGRRAEETPFLVEWFVKKGIQVWSVNEGQQRIESHADKLMNYIRFWQADGESVKTSIRTKAALAQMVKEGHFRGGPRPFGYKLVPSGKFNKNNREIHNLEIDEQEAEIVRTMFNLVLGSGFGRFKIAHTLNELGLKAKDGKNWHESSVGNILHNVLYIGILKSGDTYSEIFPHLQIVDPAVFNEVQTYMEQRKKCNNSVRSIPLRISGQSLLSGNIFCGHCGGRLSLTTNSCTVTNASGEKVKYRRVRFVCYNKTRMRQSCNGQTGYTLHILNDTITDLMHEIFAKLEDVKTEDIIEKARSNKLMGLNKRFDATQAECSRLTKEYDSLKTEVVKALQGHSRFSSDMLSDLINATREKMLEANETLSELTKQIAAVEEETAAIRASFDKLLTWADMFDDCDMGTKQHIVSQIIKRVEVRSGYQLKVELNASVEQFDLGLDHFPSGSLSVTEKAS